MKTLAMKTAKTNATEAKSKYAINTRTPPSKTRTHDKYVVKRTAEEALTLKTTETKPLT